MSEAAEGAGSALATRARADLAAGQPWLAADRLRAAVDTDPHDARARIELGDVLLVLDEPVAAGKVLVASERADPAANAAIAAWVASLGDLARPTGRVLGELEPAARLAAGVPGLGPVASARLDPLLAAARAEVARLQSLSGDDAALDDWGAPPPPTGAGLVTRWATRLGWWGFAGVCAIGAYEAFEWVGIS